MNKKRILQLAYSWAFGGYSNTPAAAHDPAPCFSGILLRFGPCRVNNPAAFALKDCAGSVMDNGILSWANLFYFSHEIIIT